MMCTGVVEVRWKPSAALSQSWLGVDGTASSPGFVILKTRPNNPPEPIEVSRSTGQSFTQEKLVKKMCSPALKEILSDYKKEEAFDWLQTVATTGEIPVLKINEDTTPPGELGPLVTIGYGQVQKPIRYVQLHFVALQC